MGDAIKIGVKVGLIAVVTTAIIALFANIRIPTLDYTYFTQGLSRGLAVLYHWFPVTSIIFPIVVFLFGFEVGFRAFQLAMIATRWIFKVNE